MPTDPVEQISKRYNLPMERVAACQEHISGPDRNGNYEISVYGLAKAMDLLQISDEATVTEWVDTVFEQNSKAVADKAVSYLVGKVMKLSGWKANAVLAKSVIERKLGTPPPPNGLC